MMPFSLRRSRNKPPSDEKEVVPRVNGKELVPQAEKQAIEPYPHKQVAGTHEKRILETPGKEIVHVHRDDPERPVLKTYHIATRGRNRDLQSLEVRHEREVIYSIRRKEKGKSFFGSDSGSVWIQIYDSNCVPQSQLSFPVVAAARMMPGLKGEGFNVCLGDPGSGLASWGEVRDIAEGGVWRFSFSVNRRRFVLEFEVEGGGVYRLLDGDMGKVLARLRMKAVEVREGDGMADVDYFEELHRAPELLSLVVKVGVGEVVKGAGIWLKEGARGR